MTANGPDNSLIVKSLSRNNQMFKPQFHVTVYENRCPVVYFSLSVRIAERRGSGLRHVNTFGDHDPAFVIRKARGHKRPLAALAEFRNRSQAMDIPDFTGGLWRTPCNSNLMDATIDISKLEFRKIEKAKGQLNV